MLRVPKTLLVLLFGCALALSAKADGDRSVALIIDASGSMKASLPDGKSRMDAAKIAVTDFVTNLAPDTRLAFRAYGHQSPTSKKDCKDTSLLVPFNNASTNKNEIIDIARKLRPQGYTPITFSLTLAAQDVGKEESAARTVVLVSDGKETCDADPCAVAKALAEADAKLVVHTVGIGVDTVTRSQLQCIARMARGNYFDANSTSELTEALSKAAVKEAEVPPKKKRVTIETPKLGKLVMKKEGQFSHTVLNASGEEVGNLSVYGEVELPTGIYSVVFGNGKWTGIEIESGKTTEIKPGYLEVTPLGSDFVEVLEPETGEKVEEILWSKPKATLIPGRFDVRFGKILWPGGVEVKPGETTTLKPGVIQVNSDATMYFVVKTPEGEEVDVGDTPGNTKTAVPPGKYVLELDKEKWIKTLTDEQRKMDVELGEGEELAVDIQ